MIKNYDSLLDVEEALRKRKWKMDESPDCTGRFTASPPDYSPNFHGAWATGFPIGEKWRLSVSDAFDLNEYQINLTRDLEGYTSKYVHMITKLGVLRSVGMADVFERKVENPWEYDRDVFSDHFLEDQKEYMDLKSQGYHLLVKCSNLEDLGIWDQTLLDYLSSQENPEHKGIIGNNFVNFRLVE